MAETEAFSAARIKKELAEIQQTKIKLYELEDAGKTDPNKWLVSLLPDRAPHNAGNYKIEIEFAKEYPFKAPKIRFLTPVYHPNISEKGEISMPMIQAENWKPSVKMDHVLTALAELLCSPQLDSALRPEIAELYIKDANAYDKNVLEFCKMHSSK